MKIFSLLLFLPLLLCAKFNVQKSNSKTDLQSIDILRSEWAVYLQNKDLKASVNLFADDAVFFSPGNDNATGKKQIEALYRQVMKKYDSHINMLSKGVTASGNLAYDSGSYIETLVNKAFHKQLFIKGSYLMTLKKQPTGAWKITRIMWTQGS